MTYDLIIIGGGPAGIAAGVYAARKCLSTLLITEEIGGQSTVSTGIENWIGTPKISGMDLAKSFREHLASVQRDMVTLSEGDRVTELKKDGEYFIATTKKGVVHKGKSVLIASGASRKKLTIPGADIFEHKGVTYCASCDGPMFTSADVAVIGGGNAGFESAAQLLAYAKSVTLLHRRDDFKADAITVRTVTSHKNMRILTSVEPTEVIGEQFVQGLRYKNLKTGEVEEISVSGIFVEIGVIPSTDFARTLVHTDIAGHIVVNPKNQRTSVEGVWSAGDATDELYHQNNIAAGDGVKALEDIYLWLKTK